MGSSQSCPPCPPKKSIENNHNIVSFNNKKSLSSDIKIKTNIPQYKLDMFKQVITTANINIESSFNSLSFLLTSPSLNVKNIELNPGGQYKISLIPFSYNLEPGIPFNIELSTSGITEDCIVEYDINYIFV